MRDTSFLLKNFSQIEHELSLPWFARLDHLEHRMWIEENDSNVLWMGKASSHRYVTVEYIYVYIRSKPYKRTEREREKHFDPSASHPLKNLLNSGYHAIKMVN